MYDLAEGYLESEPHTSAENLALLEEIMTLPLDAAELLVEDELDQDEESDMRA